MMVIGQVIARSCFHPAACLGRSARPTEDPPALCSAAAACPYALARSDPPNLARELLGEPEVAIGPGRDAPRPAPVRPVRGQGESGAAARRGQAPNGIHCVRSPFGEPEVAIRPSRDAERLAALIGHTDPQPGTG